MRLYRSRTHLAGVLAALLCALVPPIGAGAETVKRLIPFQARLADGTGKAVDDGVYEMTFQIYDTAENGTPSWTEHHQTVSVIGGQVNVLLGSLESLEPLSSKFGATPLFLGITLGGPTIAANGGEMVPRHELVPAFHARSADIAAAVADHAITPNMLATGAVTTDWIADGTIRGRDIATAVAGAECSAITGAQVCDGSITGADIATGSGGVNTANIVNAAITADKLRDNEITASKLKDGAVSLSKLTPDVQAVLESLQNQTTVQSGTLRIGDLQFCWGSQSRKQVNTGNYILYSNLPFPQPFAVVPTVVMSVNGHTSGYAYAVYTHTITKTGLSNVGAIEVRNRGEDTEPAVLSYIAIGAWR